MFLDSFNMFFIINFKLIFCPTLLSSNSIVNENSGVYLMHNYTAFVKYENYTLNTLFAHFHSFILYVLRNILDSVVVIIILCLRFCSLQFNLLSLLQAFYF